MQHVWHAVRSKIKTDLWPCSQRCSARVWGKVTVLYDRDNDKLINFMYKNLLNRLRAKTLTNRFVLAIKRRECDLLVLLHKLFCCVSKFPLLTESYLLLCFRFTEYEWSRKRKEIIVKRITFGRYLLSSTKQNRDYRS